MELQLSIPKEYLSKNIVAISKWIHDFSCNRQHEDKDKQNYCNYYMEILTLDDTPNRDKYLEIAKEYIDWKEKKFSDKELIEFFIACKQKNLNPDASYIKHLERY